MSENQRLECQIRVGDAVAQLGAKVDRMCSTMDRGYHVVLSLAVMGVVSWGFFAVKAIQEPTWIAMMLVALTPFYGDGVRLLISAITGKDVRRNAPEIISRVIQFALLVGSSIFAFGSTIIQAAPK